MLIQLHADDAIIIHHRMPWSMISLFIKPPPHGLHLSSLAWGSHLTHLRKIYWMQTPCFSFFFFFLLSRDDNRTMTWPYLVMHRCPRSICLLQVHHLTLNIFSRKPLSPVVQLFSHQHLLIGNRSSHQSCENSCEALLITPLISQCFTYHKVQQFNYCDSFLIKDYFSQIFLFSA